VDSHEGSPTHLFAGDVVGKRRRGQAGPWGEGGPDDFPSTLNTYILMGSMGRAGEGSRGANWLRGPLSGQHPPPQRNLIRPHTIPHRKARPAGTLRLRELEPGIRAGQEAIGGGGTVEADHTGRGGEVLLGWGLGEDTLSLACVDTFLQVFFSERVRLRPGPSGSPISKIKYTKMFCLGRRKTARERSGEQRLEPALEKAFDSTGNVR